MFKMRLAIFLTVFAISGAFSANINLMHPLSDEFIDFINKQNSTWTAGRNFDKSTPISQMRSLLGAIKSPKSELESKFRKIPKDVEIPESFDARENWQQCDIIKVIKDQSGCGSCWAVSAASVMSDRICIHSNGQEQIYVSDEDLLSCCGTCSPVSGCDGGYPYMAWQWWQDTGIVSGGPYGSSTGCKAYSLPPCKTNCYEEYNTPKCKTSCDAESDLSYERDRTFGESYYYMNTTEQIQLEILKNGPVQAVMDLFNDFYSYQSGIYQHVAGDIAGSHAVRILGWGVENNVPYWLVANSWSEDFGERGTFKILRGQNHCHIEGQVLAGLPKL